MEDDSPTQDYTDGASQHEIEDALSDSRVPGRFRSDSQVGSSYGTIGRANEGAVFDGPANAAVPSSVSRMSHRDMSRDRMRRMSSDRSSRVRLGRHLRRRSEDSIADDRSSERIRRRYSEESVLTDQGETDDALSDDEGPGPSNRSLRRRSPSPEPAHTGVFGSIANMFGISHSNQETEIAPRRPSLSVRSSVSSKRSQRSRRRSLTSDAGSAHTSEGGDDRWGYSSGEEDSDPGEEGSLGERGQDNLSDLDFGSMPPSPRGSLPNMLSDPIFGDTRIDMEFTSEPSNPPPPGPPSRQQIYMQEEDVTVRFIGYETVYWYKLLWRIGCFVTFGLLGLLGYWFPRLWLRFVAREKSFLKNRGGFVVVEVSIVINRRSINTNHAQTPYRDISIFPLRTLSYPYSLSTVFSAKPKPDAALRSVEDPVSTLEVVEYRYLRFALDPRTGLFNSVRFAFSSASYRRY